MDDDSRTPSSGKADGGFDCLLATDFFVLVLKILILIRVTILDVTLGKLHDVKGATLEYALLKSD